VNNLFNRSKSAVSDAIGSDVIVINVATGAYYSLTEKGAQAWWSLSDHALQGSFQDCLATFAQEGLAVPDAGNSESQTPTDPLELFEKYTDMQSLLIADPIHEVDEQGWPKRK
jgi:hypothetical protein